jgi:hypothetical protein
VGKRHQRVAPEPERDVELLLNQIAAEQAAMRIVLQAFLLRLFAARREVAPRALAELREHAINSIHAMRLDADDPAGGLRWRNLVEARALELFAEIGDALDMPAQSAVEPEVAATAN